RDDDMENKISYLCCGNFLSLPLTSFLNMRAIISSAHVLRTSSRSHRILPARWFLEHQEAYQACQGTGDARRRHHRPRHNVWGNGFLQSRDRRGYQADHWGGSLSLGAYDEGPRLQT